MALDKVYIWSFNDRQRRTPDTSRRFTLPINPETYKQNFKVQYDQRQSFGSDASELKYKSTAPKELQLEFVFDGTNTVEGYEHRGIDVKDQITLFLHTVYNIEGEIHRPRFLEVHWGEFVFPCLLTNLDINYSLFLENGDPLRAKLNCSFLNYQTKEETGRRNRTSSPDLTHRRLIQPGERLDLLVWKIYEDTTHILQVAKANGLTSIRNMAPLIGKEIQFPPLDKTNAN